MVDPEAVRRRLREIDRRLGLLLPVLEAGPERFASDERLRAEAERHLQLALQSAIDIAVHILAEDTAVTPEDYGSAFIRLAEADIIDRALGERLRTAAGLRNILVHAYLDIDPGRVWEALGRLDDLRAFATAIERHLPE